VGCVGVSTLRPMCVRWCVPLGSGRCRCRSLFLALHWAWMRRLPALGRVGSWGVGVVRLCVEEGGVVISQ
jgi:hypothetical protein